MQTRFERLDPWPCQALSDLLGIPNPALDSGTLPPFWHQLYFRESIYREDIGTDGHRKRGGFLPELQGLQRMWAGSDLKFHAPLQLDCNITRSSSVESLTEKRGRSGRLVFVDVSHTLSQNDQVCWSDVHHIVYREPLDPDLPRFQGKVSEQKPDLRMPWSANEIQLFQYSALTYNGHRIHYDRDYCRDVEGYPDCIVHGPLLATLMLEACRRLEPDKTIATFSFKARAPVFCHESFYLGATKTSESSVSLWVEDGERRVRMEGKVNF